MGNRKGILSGSPACSWFLVLGFLLLGYPAFAQAPTGAVVGVVKDASGAAVEGANISLSSSATGFSRSVSSSATGDYALLHVPVGQYELTIEKTGFKSQKLTNIVLQIDQTVRLDITLAVGNVAEEVTVSGEVELAQTTDASVGEVIDNVRVTQLPLNGRQFLELGLLTEGVVTNAAGDFGGQLAGFNGPRITVNGSREDSNNFTLDGVSAIDPFYNTLTISPSIDAIQEFKVQSSSYSAEYGGQAGGLVNIVIKSGTNQLHGTAYEFFRNDKLNARNFFDPVQAKPPYHQNQFGVSLGGPIRKNKAFLFGNYEGLRIRQANTQLASVPTAAVRSGDLSSYTNTILNPFGGYAPFPGNIIPSSMLDPIAQAALQYVPLPNVPGAGDFNNYISTPTQSTDTDQTNIRYDQNLSPNMVLFTRYSFQDARVFFPYGPQQFGVATASIPGFGLNVPTRSQNLAVGLTRTFKPNLIYDFRFGFGRVSGGQVHQNAGNQFIQANNMQGYGFLPPEFYGIPRFVTVAYADIGDTTVPIRRQDSDIQFLNGFAWVHGKHQVRFGADIHRIHFNPTIDFLSRGQFNYTGSFTSLFGLLGPSFGSPFADFLLGLPTFGLQGRGVVIAHLRSTDIHPYIQDDWKVTSRLTLNLGLRYELNTAFTEENNRISTFDPVSQRFIVASEGGQTATSLYIAGTQQAVAPLPFVTSEQAGVPRSLVTTNKKNFGPRIGLAWDVRGDQKWVVRSGYGIFYNRPTLNQTSLTLSTPPFFDVVVPLQPLLFGLPAAGPQSLFGPGAIALPPLVFPINLKYPTAYLQQWNLSAQHLFTKTLSVELKYVGSKGTHLQSIHSFNAPLPSSGPAVGLTPQLSAGSSLQSSDGNSNYNAGSLRVEKRSSHGLFVVGNYTWSKSLDYGSTTQSLANTSLQQDPRCTPCEYGRSTFDARHRLVASFGYDLPFGQGKAYLNNLSSGFARKLVEGWQITGIESYQSGLPFTVVLIADKANDGEPGTNQRPNLIGDPNLGGHSATQWFNTSAFDYGVTGTYGNEGRNILTADATRSFDVGILKDTALTETQKLQFRAEIFNAFNQTNFGFPDRFRESPTFGRITSAKDPRIVQFALKYVF